MTRSLQISEEVSQALASAAPVVLLETAVLTCGLPRSPWLPEYGDAPEGLQTNVPLNLATVRAMANAVTAAGCVPAITAILHGTPRIGLSDAELDGLASDAEAGKASSATIAHAIASGMSAGTTVSGTLRLAAAASAEGLPHPRVFATGGIGGVHTGWPGRFDISADLAAIARTPTCVVCSGPKSVIDDVTTMEALESLGVPVIGLNIDVLPGFQSLQSAHHVPITAATDVGSVASIARTHWSLPQSGGLLACNPPPTTSAMCKNEVCALATEAEAAVTQQGPARTPALLSHMASASAGRTLLANVDLLRSNAAAAASIAHSLAS